MKKKRAKKKNKFFNFWNVLLILILLILIVIGGVFVFAYGNPAEGFRTNHTTFSEVNASNICIEVNNSHSTNDYFVPSATYSELNSFYNNLPSGVIAASCDSYPPRIAYYYGKVNQYTDPVTGEWKTDSDCSSGGDIPNLTYCQDRYGESITYDTQIYAMEYIYDWKTSGCGGSENWTKPSVRCRLCTLDYTYQSACEGASCSWHPYGYGCGRFQCSSYTNYDECNAAGCYWDGSCHIAPSDDCSYFTSSEDCGAESGSGQYCTWDPGTSCCYNYYNSCDPYYDEYECSLYYPACQWHGDQNRCHEACPM